jgi:hypothetical protein
MHGLVRLLHQLGAVVSGPTSHPLSLSNSIHAWAFCHKRPWTEQPAGLPLLKKTSLQMSLSPLGLLPMLLLPHLPTVMTTFSFRVSHTVLLWFCVMVMLRLFSRAAEFLAFPPPPPILLLALNLPCRLAAMADALLGTNNSDLLLLLLPSVHLYLP